MKLFLAFLAIAAAQTFPAWNSEGALHPNSNTGTPYQGTVNKQNAHNGVFTADQNCPLTCTWDGSRIRVEHHHLADILLAEKNHGASETTKDDNHGKMDNPAYDNAHAAANIYHRCYHRDTNYVHNTVPFSFSLDSAGEVNINEGKNPTLTSRSCQCQCAQWSCETGVSTCKFGSLTVHDNKCPTATRPTCSDNRPTYYVGRYDVPVAHTGNIAQNTWTKVNQATAVGFSFDDYNPYVRSGTNEKLRARICVAFADSSGSANNGTPMLNFRLRRTD